ncbi:hypothetical protein Ancab_003445 [Ancistrocladus abbreviatus]
MTWKREQQQSLKVGEKASELMMGCCVVVLREAGQPLSDSIEVNSSTIVIGCWKGRSNTSVMVSEIDCRDLLERVVRRFGTEDVSPIQEKKREDTFLMQEMEKTRSLVAENDVVMEDMNETKVQNETDDPEEVERIHPFLSCILSGWLEVWMKAQF